MTRETSGPAIVYQATNLINGNIYIGVTGKKLKERESSHWSARAKKSGFLLPRAMKKYGREMFRFIVLKECATYREALDIEIRLIAALHPRYNLSGGGDGSLGCAITTKQRSDRRRQIKKHGHKVWAASAAAHRKPVICLQDGQIYPSGKDAACAYGISCATMTYHLKGRRATAAGRLFSFYTGKESALPNHDDIVRSIQQKQRLLMIQNTPRRPVVCTTTGIRYPSLCHAEAESGVPYGCLSRILGKRGLKSWRGLKFEYAP